MEMFELSPQFRQARALDRDSSLAAFCRLHGDSLPDAKRVMRLAEWLEPPDVSDSFPVIPGYDLVSLLPRQGGMATVVLARQLRRNPQGEVLIDREVVIKVTQSSGSHRRETVAEFLRECRSLVELDTVEGIVGIYDAGEIDQQPYVVMERLVGMSLEEYLHDDDRPQFTHVEAVEFIERVARTLDIAHERGIIHRDLKPQNLFLCRADQFKLGVHLDLPELNQFTPKIIDFGIALVQHESQFKNAGAGIPGIGPRNRLIVSGKSLDHRRMSMRWDLFCAIFFRASRQWVWGSAMNWHLGNGSRRVSIDG